MMILHRLSYALLWLLVFAMPWENMVLVPGLGTLTRLVGIGAAGLTVLGVLWQGRLRTPVVGHGLMLAFVGWTLAGMLWSLEPALTRHWVVTYGQLAVMAWVIWECAADARAQRGLLAAYVLGAGVSVGATIVTFLQGQAVFYGRYAAAGFDPNDLGVILALGIPMAWYLTRDGGRIAWGFGLYPLVALLGIALTASRGAFVAACVALLLVLDSVRELTGRGRWLLLGGGVLGVLSLLALVPPEASHRLASLGREVQQGTWNERLTIWEAGWSAWLAHPLLGVGTGNYGPAVQAEIGRPVAAHNTFLSILVERGVIGCLLFAGMVAVVLLGIQSLPRRARYFWWVLWATWAIGALTLSFEMRKPTWFIVGLGLAHAAAVRRDAGQVPAEDDGDVAEC
jgi:O-antigen ligase